MLNSKAAVLAQVWRGEMLESFHTGHAVVVDALGGVVAAWGDPSVEIYPRSSSKMLQALPLVESGAADAVGLGTEHLALACASHNGALIHTDRVSKWLGEIGFRDDDLRCGAQAPGDRDAREALIQDHAKPCQWHNNCSGKHAGFLTLGKHFGAGPEYLEPDHPVQTASRAVFEDMTDAPSPRFAIDGCSAPNFATTVQGLATGMAQMANLRSGVRGKAAERLVAAMRQHPDLVAGEGRACTALMRAMPDGVVKTGAEGVFAAILPKRGFGVALKVSDGTTRAAEAAMAGILVGLGALDADHPTAKDYTNKDVRNWRGILTGHIKADEALMSAL